MHKGVERRRNIGVSFLPMSGMVYRRQKTEDRKYGMRNAFTRFCRLSPVAYPRGFTLVEMMVAIAILTISIVGPFIVAESSYQAAASSRDQLTASYLAQEAVEYVRSIRDNNYLAVYPAHATPSQWLAGLSACMTPKVCTVDPTGNAVPTTCTDGTCAGTPLNLSSSDIYNQASQSSTNLPTRFVRRVSICTGTTCSAAMSQDEAVVTVVVTWATAHRTFTTTVADHFFNWL